MNENFNNNVADKSNQEQNTSQVNCNCNFVLQNDIDDNSGVINVNTTGVINGTNNNQTNIPSKNLCSENTDKAINNASTKNVLFNTAASSASNMNTAENLNTNAAFGFTNCVNLGVNQFYDFNKQNKNNYTKEHPNLLKFKVDFKFISLLTLAFALIFTISIFRNINGLMTAFIPIISLVYSYYVFKRNDKKIQKKDYFLCGSFIALGINLFLIQDVVLLIFDYIGMIILLFLIWIRAYYEDSLWSLKKYIDATLSHLLESIGQAFLYFSDLEFYRKNHVKHKRVVNSNLKYVLLAIIVSVPVLAILLPLLSSADMFFSEFVGNIVDFIFDDCFCFLIDMQSENAFLFTIIFIASFGGMYGFNRTFNAKVFKDYNVEETKGNVVFAITLNSIIGIVYLIFSGFQIFYLFLGNMTLPEKYTYADYAKEGFFQLVVVCIINMFIVVIALKKFENTKALKGTLLLISFCTYIMIASSTIRMIMYVKAYQLTFLRVFVFWGLINIFILMTGIVYTIFKSDFPLFKYGFVIVLFSYLIFAFSNPTSIIVKNNLSPKFTVNENGEKDYSKIDFFYIYRLSTDGSTEIRKAIERENDKEFTEKLYYCIADKAEFEDNFILNSIRKFNVSRYMNELNFDKINN